MDSLVSFFCTGVSAIFEHFGVSNEKLASCYAKGKKLKVSDFILEEDETLPPEVLNHDISLMYPFVTDETVNILSSTGMILAFILFSSILILL